MTGAHLNPLFKTWFKIIYKNLYKEPGLKTSLVKKSLSYKTNFSKTYFVITSIFCLFVSYIHIILITYFNSHMNKDDIYQKIQNSNITYHNPNTLSDKQTKSIFVFIKLNFKVNESRYRRCGITPHFPKTKK